MNTIFIIVVLVSLKTEGQYTCTLLFCPEHKLTIAGARIISRNPQCFLEIPGSLQPHPPVHISLKTITFPSCFIIDDKVNESTLQHKTPTIIYYEYHCICIALKYHYPIWSSLWVSAAWGNGIIILEMTKLNSTRFVPKTQSSRKQWQDVNSGFMIPHPELCSFIKSCLSYVKCLTRHQKSVVEPLRLDEWKVT